MSQRIENVLAPAKLNLFLHIVGVRPDGYHLLQSVFTMIDWCDTLHFDLRPNEGRITREDLTIPLPEHDLIVRAAQALQQATSVSHGAHIQVEKHIPSQAGMGGGSSDAAATLWALNQLWGTALSSEQLQRIGLTLGADVPFFLAGRTAWVEGVGERIQALDEASLPPASRFVVVKPQFGLETAKIFSHPLLKRNTPCARISDFAAAPFDFGQNDMQQVAEILCSDVNKTLNWLKDHKFQARMTGSGSAVFAHIPDNLSSQTLEQFLASAPSHWDVRICNSLHQHPVWGCK